MDDVKERSQEFKRNVELEALLKEINTDLYPTERALLQQEIAEYPVIFVMGALRSGSTLIVQWLASTGEFAYPSNMLSRFYMSPIIGSKIQRLLTDPKYNFRNEIMDFDTNISFNSNNGKTRGALEPNEFWYFWRRFLPDDLRGYTSEDLLKDIDIQTMRRELWGMAQVFGKPVALKGMICNYHIPFLNQVFPKAVFISMHRNMNSQVRSVLEARKRQYGSSEKWYSFLIPEYEELSKISVPEVQARRQIECINQAVAEGLETVPDDKKIQVKYEQFCQNPEYVYHEIQKKLEKQNFFISEDYNGKKSFEARM